MINKIVYQDVFCFEGEQEKESIFKEDPLFQIILQSIMETHLESTGYVKVWLYSDKELVKYLEVPSLFSDKILGRINDIEL